MTSTTFLPNAGVYKNTLRRFRWGSFLYFIALFFCVPFYFMVHKPIALNADLHTKNLLLSSQMLGVPIAFAYAVPTVVALLIFNCVHSSRHGIFAHSIPVTRTQNYLSGLLAAFTLMFAPVLANALILLVLRSFGYGKIITLSSVALWAGINIFILFVMFSVAAFSSFLTGNSFAQAVINIIIHLIPVLLAFAITLVCDTFVYGYTMSDSSFAEQLLQHTPAVWLANQFQDGSYNSKFFSDAEAWAFFAMALAFYALSLVLYKKRKIENCGEVAAFAVFKPILKYSVTAITAIAAFGILKSMELAGAVVFTVAFIICAIVYFSCEMILNKTLRVFGSYKGYAAFSVCCAAVIAFFAFGDIFGYETYVPDVNELSWATVCREYHEVTPISSEKGALETVTSFHKELLKDIPYLNDEHKKGKNLDYLLVKYKLKSGKTVDRMYNVPYEKCDEALNKMFAYGDYKLDYTGISQLNIENADNMELSIYSGDYSYSYALNEDTQPILNALKSDVEAMSYREFSEGLPISIEFRMQTDPKSNEKTHLFKPDGREYYYNFSICINLNYTNTLDYLKEKGYYDLIRNNISDKFSMVKTPVKRELTRYTYKGEESKYGDFTVISDDMVRISKEDGFKLFDICMERNHGEMEPGENYIVRTTGDTNSIFYASNYTISFKEDKLPEFLLKYLQ